MKVLRIISICLLLLVGVNALVAGFLLMKEPSGSKMEITLSRLQHSPFRDFFIPGAVLFIANGVLNVVASAFVLFKWKSWSRFIIFQGIILTGWIIIQVILLQEFHFLHFIFAGIGSALVSIGSIMTTKLRNE
jgi:hypothetical protein